MIILTMHARNTKFPSKPEKVKKKLLELGNIRTEMKNSWYIGLTADQTELQRE